MVVGHLQYEQVLEEITLDQLELGYRFIQTLTAAAAGRDWRVTNRDGTTPVNAPNNFWGASNGPFNATNNPGGLGSDVADDVTFTPFETTAPPVIPAPTMSPIRSQPMSTSVLVARFSAGGIGV